MSICDKDCLHCSFEDCVNDELDAADYRAARDLENFIRPKTHKEQAIAAKQREYREANREAIAAKQREYYAANREAIAAKRREYYEAHRDERIAKATAWQKEHPERHAAAKRRYLERKRRMRV